MDIYVITSLILVVAVLGYTIFLKPYLDTKKVLTQSQLDLIDFACKKGVEYAEQIFKNDPNIDRNVLAIDSAFEIIDKTGVIPMNYIPIIRTLIESHVLKLPKTHS